MSKKRRARRAVSPAGDERKVVHLVMYNITTEPVRDRQYKKLPRRVRDMIEQFHDQVQNQPRKAIPGLLEWIEKYPHVPQFYNYLYVAYAATGQRAKMKAAALDNYRRNPDYLFARLNYAEVLLGRRDYDRVAEVFESKFDLKLLYPKRDTFHITEVVGFMLVVGQYFIGIGQCDVAIKYYEVLEQIAPGSRQTRQLRRELRRELQRERWRNAHSILVRRLVRWLRGR